MNLPPRRLTALVALAAVLLAGRVLQADEAYGTIRITVTDAAPSGASVVLASGRQPSRRWPAEVGAAGLAVVSGLPPAAYRLTATLAGGQVGTTTVDVGAGETVSVEVSVGPPPGGGLVFRVTDRARPVEATVFSRTLLDALPAGNDASALLETAAPWAMTDGFAAGGLALGSLVRVGSQGASWTQTSVTMGDLRLPVPGRAGDMAFAPDPRAVQDMLVSSGMAPVDAAASGTSIILSPRRPGPTREGALDLSFSTPGMVAAVSPDAVQPIARLHSWRDVGLEIGGPVRPGFGGFVSGGVRRGQQDVRGEPVPPTLEKSLFAHGVANLSPRDELRVWGAVQGVTRAYPKRAQLQASNVSEADVFVQSQAAWSHDTLSGAHADVSMGAIHGRVAPAIASSMGGTIDRVTDGAVPPPPTTDVLNRWQVRAVFAAPPIGRETLRAGIVLDRTTAMSDVVALPTVGELAGGVPARAWVPVWSGATSHRRTTDAAVFVEDTMAVADRLTIDAGLRVDAASGAASGAAQGISWHSLAPRVSIRWAPRALVVFGGYGRYDADLPIDLLRFGDPAEPSENVYRWTDANGDGQVGSGELGALVERAGQGQAVASIDPGLRRPTTDEFTLGAERQLGGGMTVRASAVVRRSRALWRAVNVGAPLSAYTVLSIPDAGVSWDGPSDDRLLTVYDRRPATFGADAYLLSTPEGDAARSSYDGLEIGWTLRTARWRALLGATAYRVDGPGGDPGYRAQENDQGVTGALLGNPNAASYVVGRLFFDRAYVLKWSTVYRAPHDLLLAATARYQDGQPFARLVVDPALSQGPEIVQAYTNGRTRFTFVATADVRVQKGFEIAGHRWAVTLDIFNLTNRAGEVEENALSGGAFRQTTAVQPPRTLRLGVQLSF